MSLDVASLSDERRATLERAWRAENSGDPAPVATGGSDPTSPFGELVAKRKADLTRQQAITDACSAAMDAHPGRIADIEAVGQTAISQGWNRERTELELLRKLDRSSVSPASPSSRAPVEGKVVEAAMLKASGLPGVEKLFDERTLQRADDAFGNRGLSLGEALTMTARNRGWRGHSYSGDLENVLRYSFGNEAMSSGAVPSTYSLPNIFSNVANKSLKVYFEAVDQSWRDVSAIGSARDFKQTTDISLTGGLLLEDLPPSGEIKAGTVGEAVYTNKVSTKALSLGISRTDLINDDLGALNRATQRMARGAALRFNKDFWTTFLSASSAFFDASLNNAGSNALTMPGLEAANTMFRTQKDPDGNFLGCTPKILLVSTGLEVGARQIMSSTNIVATGTTDVKFGSVNVMAGMFKVVANPYVGDSTYGGASTRWYLLADPAELPVIETKFLNGNQTPTVEQAMMNWNLLGISMRTWFDYGVALQERRAGVKQN